MSTRLWLLLAFVTPSLCRQRRLNGTHLITCSPDSQAAAREVRFIAQARKRLTELQLQAALKQGKEQGLNKVLLLAQRGLFSRSCSQQGSLIAAAALDGAVHLLRWDSQTLQEA